MALPAFFPIMAGFLAILKREGVTSKISSLARYSTDASNDNTIGAVIPMVMPLLAERMLVSALVLQTLTARSPGRWWIPTLEEMNLRREQGKVSYGRYE